MDSLLKNRLYKFAKWNFQRKSALTICFHSFLTAVALQQLVSTRFSLSQHFNGQFPGVSHCRSASTVSFRAFLIVVVLQRLVSERFSLSQHFNGQFPNVSHCRSTSTLSFRAFLTVVALQRLVSERFSLSQCFNGHFQGCFFRLRGSRENDRLSALIDTLCENVRIM